MIRDSDWHFVTVTGKLWQRLTFRDSDKNLATVTIIGLQWLQFGDSDVFDSDCISVTDYNFVTVTDIS